MSLILKVKKIHPDAQLPRAAYPGDAGLDLVALTRHVNESASVITFGTGIALEIPRGYVGLLFPRSSAANYGTIQANCVGVIDSGYRGEIIIKHQVISGRPQPEIGDKIAQLIVMPYPEVDVQIVHDLEETVRGSGAFGSSGR